MKPAGRGGGTTAHAAAAQLERDRLTGAAAAADRRRIPRIIRLLANRRHIPERKCVACGLRFPKLELIRVVRTPEGTVLVDQAGKTPGRGAYVCRSETCWQRGVPKTSIERSLNITMSPESQAQVLDFYRTTVEAPVSREQ